MSTPEGTSKTTSSISIPSGKVRYSVAEEVPLMKFPPIYTLAPSYLKANFVPSYPEGVESLFFLPFLEVLVSSTVKV